MKTILIPTDFTLRSLDMVKAAAARFNGPNLKIILFHALHTPADIQDLLFINKAVPHEKITEDFRHACAAIKKQHKDGISLITFRHMYGNTSPVFKNFLEANNIDAIYMPQHVALIRPYANSVDVRPLFKKAHVPFITDSVAAVKENRENSVRQYSGNMAMAEG
jgi:hypothetical protein